MGTFPASPTARLRLVGGEPAAPPSPRAVLAARREVAQENHAAVGLRPGDPRLVLALDTARALDGGKAAILRPERRRQLVASATNLGLRPFDAHLVIAVVQDAARRGEGVADQPVESRIAMVPRVKAERPIRLGLWAAGMALLMLGMLILWAT